MKQVQKAGVRPPLSRKLLFVAVTLALSAAVSGVLLFLKQNQRPDAAPDALGYAKRSPGTVTFAQDIAPIIYRRCSVCHRTGQAAPFPLLTYGDVKKKALQ